MAALLVNGVNYSSSSVNNIAFGVPVTGLVGIKWSAKQVKDNNYNTGTDPVSRGYGQKTYDCTITVYKDWWKKVCDAAPDKDPLNIAPFDWTIAYGDARTQFFTETLGMFEFLEDGSNVNAGDTKLTVDIPCVFAGIKRS